MMNKWKLSKLILTIIFCASIIFSGKIVYAYNKKSLNDEIKLYTGVIDSSPARQTYLLNNDWFYSESRISSVKELENNKLSWQKLDLPHTWNRFDATDNNPGYRRDESWYTKEITIPDVDNNLIFMLNFEGVNISCDVYVNGQKAGSHTGGYVGFKVDITPHIKEGGTNRIAVRVDNGVDKNIIPSQKSDFFLYGGIVRDVWLEILPLPNIKNVQISTPQVSDEIAQTEVVVRIQNKDKEIDQSTINLTIVNPEGKTVAQKQIEAKLAENENIISVTLPEVNNPLLWSPDHPNLYKMHISLTSGKSTDQIIQKFGYRWYRFEEHGPFYLNGKRVLLRGTHRHEEFAGYGNAMPDSLHRLDMVMIKEMGANFVRLAHYPQDPEIYRACDELGLLVWDELPWCRGGVGGKVWKAHTKRLLEEQIRQNYNHPSIILWSLGNEMYWEPDFPDGGNIDSLRSFLTVLNNLAHGMDPGRKTAIRKFYDGDDIVDVFSPSIWAGWYSGVYKSYELGITKAKDKYKRMFHAEYGGASHVGRHTENPITGEGMIKEDEWAEKPNMIGIKKISSSGDWSENYIVDLFDWHLHVSEQLDWVTGNAQWAFKDFGTPLRPENAIPYINQKGLVDRSGKPKDAYYVFKSYWTTDPKFCYIESPTWTERTGNPGEKKQVCVYSNCDKVRLVINGNNLEKREKNIKDFPASGFHWDVVFEEGVNQIIAFGSVDDKIVSSDSLIVKYSTLKSAKPTKIMLSSNQLKSGNFLIEALMVDENNNRCLDYNKRVYFDHNGPGKLVKYFGTPTGSDIIEFASSRAAIEFIPEGIGTAIIEARNQDFKGSYITIECE
jgi:beta-galactosidase